MPPFSVKSSMHGNQKSKSHAKKLKYIHKENLVKKGDFLMSQFDVTVANLLRIAQLKCGMLGKVDFQKTVYLAKQLGVYVPFEFRWDKLGPYSFELAHFVNLLVARDIFLIEKGKYIANSENTLVNQSESLTTISHETQGRLFRLFNSIRQTVRNEGFRIPNFMECLGSIHFIKASLQNPTEERVFHTLELLKPDRVNEFAPMRERAWSLLEENNL